MSGVFSAVAALSLSPAGLRNWRRFGSLSSLLPRRLLRGASPLDHAKCLNGKHNSVRLYRVLSNHWEITRVSQSAARCDSLLTDQIICYNTVSQSGSRYCCAAANQRAPSASSVDSRSQPRFLLAFTCKVCNQRVQKTVSRQAYLHGVVLVQCDGCQNRHLIADRLGWFSDRSVDVETLLAARGEHVRRNVLQSKGVNEISADASPLELPQPVTSSENDPPSASVDEDPPGVKPGDNK